MPIVDLIIIQTFARRTLSASDIDDIGDTRSEHIDRLSFLYPKQQSM